MALLAQKDAARRAMRATLRALPAELRAKESASASVDRPAPDAEPLFVAGLAVTERLLTSDMFKNSRSVGVYVSCERLHEVDTFPVLRHLLQQGAPCCVRTRARGTDALSSTRARTGGAGKYCFVPLVGAAPRQMRLLRIGAAHCRSLLAAQAFNTVFISDTCAFTESLADLVPNGMGILEPQATAPSGEVREDGVPP